MSSSRSLTLDTRILLNWIPTRAHGGDTAGPKVYENDATSTALYYSAGVVPAGPRMPSRRPIDRRWDRSRGIIFRQREQNVIRDFRRSRRDGSNLEQTPADRRYYAMRPGSFRSSIQSTTQSDLVTDSHKISPQMFSGSGSLPRELDQARKINLELKKQIKQQEEDTKSKIAATKAYHEREIASVSSQVTADKTAQERRTAITIQELEDEHEKKLAKLRLTESHLANRAREYEERESRLMERETALDTTIADAKRKSQEAANARVESTIESAELSKQHANLKMRDLDHEMSKFYMEADDKMSRVKREFSLDLQQYKDALTASYVADMTTAREAGLHREKVERADYASYHDVWDKVRMSSVLLQRELYSAKEALVARFRSLERILTNHIGGQNGRWLPHTYPKLHWRLHEYTKSMVNKTQDSLRQLSESREAFNVARDQVLGSAHISRRLTRHLHFRAYPNKYDESMLVNEMLNEVEIRRTREQNDHELERAKQMLDRVLNASEKETLWLKCDALRRRRASLTILLRFFSKFREREALKALLSGSTLEKEIFVATQAPTELVHEAHRRWKEVSDTRPAGGDDPNRRDYGKRQRTARNAIADIQNDIRKRRQLQMHLGKSEDNTAQFDAQISSLLVVAEESLAGVLGRLTGQDMRPGTGFTRRPEPIVTRRRSLSRPAAVSPTLSRRSPSLPVEERRRLRVDSKSGFRKLDAKLAGMGPNASEQDKHSVKKQYFRSTVEEATKRFDTLEECKTNLSQSQSADPAKTELLDRDLNDAANALSREQAHARALESGVSRSWTTAGPSRRTSKRAATRRRADERWATLSNSNIKSDGSTPVRSESKEASSGGGAGSAFQPTLAQHAPYVFWPVSKSSHSFLQEFGLSTESVDRVDEVVGRATASTVTQSNTFNVWSDDQDNRAFAHGQATSASTSTMPRTGASSEDEYKPLPSSGSSCSEIQPEQTLNTSSESASTSSLVSMMQVTHLDEASTEKEGIRDAELTYQIPAEDYRNAVLASKSTSAAFWTLKLYRNAEGKQPVVYYCTNYEKTEERAKEFLNETVLGFDIEWEMYASMTKSSIKDNVSLIQIASEDKIGLFQIAMFKGDNAEQLMPPSLRSILESRNIVKAGVNVRGDARRLKQCLGVNMTGLFELSHLYRIVKFSETQPQHVNKKLVSMADQVQNVLLLPLKKDAVRTSAWSKKLDAQQSEYAASDAYAGFRLYHALDAKRRKLNPVPPCPDFLEDEGPLRYWNGERLVMRSYPKRNALVPERGEKVDEEDDEEYFDAVESFSTYQLDSSTATDVTVPAPEDLDARTRPTYPDLPRVETLQISEAEADPQDPIEPSAPSSKPTKKSTAPPSSELAQADQWVTSWRSSLPASYNLKTGPSPLRAYHLWHQQNFDCAQVATFLRDPPLALPTIASYVMQAVKEENLPYDAERLREPLGILPKSVHGRYQRFVNQMERC